MRQNAVFVNRENQENSGRTTFSMEDDDLNSEETYSYDHLTAQPDMNVVQVADLSSVSENGKIDRNQVRSAGLENSKAISNGRFGNYDSVQNAYTRKDLLIAGSSIRHGLSGSFVRLSVNSKLGAIVGSLVQNAIPINALQPTNPNVVQTYAMAGVCTDGANDYLGIIHVNRQTNIVDKVELLDYVHSINGRVRKNNSFDAKSTHYATETVVPGTVVSKVSIAEVLELVKGLPSDVLSPDVPKHFGR